MTSKDIFGKVTKLTCYIISSNDKRTKTKEFLNSTNLQYNNKYMIKHGAYGYSCGTCDNDSS